LVRCGQRIDSGPGMALDFAVANHVLRVLFDNVVLPFLERAILRE
jgi:hypothetical protein